MTTAQIIAISIFVLVMILIISEKVHRTVAAMAGAMVLFLCGIMTFDTGVSHIDFNTLGVLLGMMLFVAIVKTSGLFEFLAVKAAKIAKGDPWFIMIAFIIITALLSAFLDNVTTVLLMGPMTLTICRLLDVDPVPFFMTEIIASNIGGTSTLIGDPPNIMIGSATGFTFFDFVINDGPAVLLVLIATIICFRFIYGRKLHVEDANKAKIMELNENEFVKSRSTFIKSVTMIFLVAVAFMLHGAFGVESSIIALTAAAIMMIICPNDIEVTVHGVEWTTIGFFAGLFIVVGGLSETGVILMLADFIMNATAGQAVLTMIVLLWASALISSILDNIPFIATLIPVLLAMEASGMDVTPLWWAASLGGCLGGNGTLIGASANVVLSGISNREGYPITFISYFKTAFPLMIMSIVISSIYLLVRF